MKVILLKDIKKIGQLGDEVEVKDGYARNYLIPKKEAIEATAGAMKVLEQKKKKVERKQLLLKEESEKISEKIKAVSCTISMEAGEEDKLFGAVTSEMIGESLQAEGIEIDKRKIVLPEPIKNLGVHNIEIHLHPEVKVELRIWVVKK